MLRALEHESPPQMGKTEQIDVVRNHVLIDNFAAASAADLELPLQAASEFRDARIRRHNRISRCNNTGHLPSRDD
jgi:hypothetical protein